MTDAECQEAMTKREKVRYVGYTGSTSHYYGKTATIITKVTIIGMRTLWGLEMPDGTQFLCGASSLERVVAASPPLPPTAPTQTPPAFQVGDHVIFVSTSGLTTIPPGTKGTIVRVIFPGTTYEVDFPVYPCRPGVSWAISHQGLQHDPAFPPAATLTQAGSITSSGLPVQASRCTFLPTDRTAADYPHVCPTCKAPAYIGFSKIDCSAGCP